MRVAPVGAAGVGSPVVWSAAGRDVIECAQRSRLNRLAALDDLGFTLQQVRSILDQEISPEELRGMPRLRRAGLQARIAGECGRLEQVGEAHGAMDGVMATVEPAGTG